MARQKKKIITENYNSISAQYDEATKNFSWAVPAEVEKLVQDFVTSDSRVLDLGVGTGQTIDMAIGKGARVCGVDIAQKMLDLAAAKYPNAEFLCDDIEEGLPTLKGRTFDLIIASGVLEFVEDLEKALIAITQLLDTQAHLCFSFEKRLSNHPVQNKAVSESREGYTEEGPETSSFYHHRRTEEEVRKLLEEISLEVKQSHDFTAYYKSKDRIPVEYHIILAHKPA